MNLDSLSFALSNISYSVANLTKKNFKSSVQEISRLVACHGLEAEQHLLRCLFSHVDFSGDGKSSGKDFHQTQLLIQECASILNKPNFVSTFCYAIDCPLQQQKSLRPSSSLLSQLSKVLKLSSVQEVAFGLALLNSSILEHSTHSVNFLKQKLPDFIKHICDQDSSSQDSLDLPPVILHLLLNQLYTGTKDLGVSSDLREKLSETLHQTDKAHLSLLPYLSTNNLDPTMEPVGNSTKTSEDSVVELIQEMGYNFTSSVEECKNNVMQIGLRDITPAIVARILSMMSRTCSGLTDAMPIQNLNSSMMWGDTKEKSDSNQQPTWNVEVFVQVVREMAPSLDWKEVVMELDNPGFLLKDRKGFKLLWQGFSLGLGSEKFPMERMYRRWRNLEGQFTFFQQVLNCSDILCLIDYPHRPVLTDALKAPPEDDNKSILNWKSLDLLETLLNLSETPYFKDEIFKFPLSQCPDLLLLGLIQSPRNINTFHKELLASLIPVFLGNHPNSAMVLHLAWHCQYHPAAVKNIVMHAMADWYARGDGDQARLSRILDVAQDLKALSLLLNLSPFLFVIDLACLASRREYLKLDKWLNDKVREHGETFIDACVTFLIRRCPQIMGGNIKEENLPKTALPPETLATMLSMLHTLVGSTSQELSEKILTMVGNCAVVLNKNRLPPPGVVKTSQGLQSVLSSAVNNAPNSALDQLCGLPSSVAGLTLGNSVKTISSGNSAFPSLPGALTSFSIPSSGSPAKLLSVGTPAAKPGTTNSQITQNQFSTVMAAGNPQLPSQFGDVGQILTETGGAVSKEIEDEANSYFQRIYNHSPHSSLPIEDVLDMLKRFQESPVQRERDVCSCMLKNLFEEYRFFPQYPDKELMITAQLFGGIVEQNLVSYLSLGLALRYVLESVKKPQGTKMFYFGVTAMDRFKSRLKEYPAYCQHLTTIPNFHELPQHLIEHIEYGARSQEPPPRPQTVVTQNLNTSSTFPTLTPQAPSLPNTGSTTTVTVTTSSASKPPMLTGKPSIANATNIDTLLVATEKDEKLVVPPEAVQDKVAFIVNNLSLANLTPKTDEFREVMKDEYFPWASQYVVMKRASIEPNFHSLYSSFLDTLKLPELVKLVIQETFRNIKVLLRSDKGAANFSDRSLLKNLGHWLGILTLGKCKPIKQIDIDVKALLIEAHGNGPQELLYVVPFVAKVLEACSKSKVFKPPNPWTMGIMRVLSEMHKENDLKLNLKFEIEVLCKALGLDINEVKPSTVLKEPIKYPKENSQLSPLTKMKDQPTIMQVPPAPALTNVVPPSPMVNSVLHEESLQNVPPLGSPSASMAANQIAPLITSLPQPQFAYGDISIVNTSQIGQHLMINNQLPLFQTHGQLKQCVRMAIERAVQEWLGPVVDRSVKISLTTCEQIIKKDFALDPEESRMRLSAHHMIRSLTAGMVMITCRDPLFVSITNNLRSSFLGALRNPSNQQKDMAEQAIEIVAHDNLELACCFIQKTAVEKALPEIDKRLSSEYEARKHARSEGRRYCDPMALTYQAERMPEQIRLKVGGVTPQQMAVYEEFALMIPGFLPNGEREQQQQNAFMNKPVAMMQPYVTDELTDIYDKLVSQLEVLVRGIVAPNNSHLQALHALLEAIFVARANREMSAAVTLLQKTVEGFLEGMSLVPADNEIALRFRDGHLLVMKALADPRVYGHQWTSKQITRWLIESREECRYNPEAVDLLIRNHLINLQAYDLHLTQSMENGMNHMAVSFAMQLVKLYLLDERQSGLVSETDLYNTVDTLIRVSNTQRQPPEGLPQLLELLRSSNEPFMDRAPGSTGPVGMMYSGITQAREFDDPPGLYEKTEYLLREWVTMYHAPNAGRDSTKAFSLFVHQMNVQGILKTDELITRFFRLSTEMCVDLSYRVLTDQATKSPTVIRAKCFHTLDAYVRLIALLVKHSGDASNTVTKVNLLNKVLGIVTGVLLQDHEFRGVDFMQLPYHRIFIMLFLELNAPESVLEAINPQILSAFCNTLYYLRPQKAPGFAYAWLELVSHRVFLGRVLALSPAQKVTEFVLQGWTMYAQLLVSLFKFLSPFLRNVELPAPIHLLYKGTLRVLLVLLHDFPEFLCDYHYGFCDVIAPNCIQMRNLILSAFPRNMRLPDPFTPNLKVDLLPEITQAPRILANFNNLIQPPTFKKDLDSYIKTRAPVTFLSELRTSLQVSSETGMRYNIPLINALVLYVGTQAISYIQSKGSTPNMSTITHSSHMDIFQNLAVDSDTEGRYLFLNAIANQLRYPNSHTHYFSCTLLYLFAEANTEAIQEQITRVLLERLIVNRPHPWGLLITFIELIKNQNFKFWNHEFVRCAPEIEKLFESVARSCMHPKPSSEQAAS